MKNKEVIIRQIETDSYKAGDGLTEEMFLLASELLPLTNVDLLLLDKAGRVLLSWRDDEYCGTGWHIPGGIIRHGETRMERLYKTALSEIGIDVKADEEPIKISEVFLKDQVERNHFISFLYKCYLPDDFDPAIINKDKDTKTPGYLQFFDTYPGLVWSQDHYVGFLRDYFNNYRENKNDKE